MPSRVEQLPGDASPPDSREINPGYAPGTICVPR